MKLRTSGRSCYLCGKEIKPASRFDRTAGDEVLDIKIKRGPTRYVHVTCWEKVPKQGPGAKP